MDFPTYKAMLAAHEAGTATPEQQRAMHAHLLSVKQQHARELRDAERDARDAYSEGKWDAAAESRGDPLGCY